VTSLRTNKPPPSKAVFVNCPFDDGFRPIFRAMTFAIIASSYYPRCALDAIDGAEIRVSKIAKMIGECDWGIHDLSRVEVDTAGVPRFNMPMELGLHLGARLFGSGRHRRKRALILEAQSHRYDAGRGARLINSLTYREILFTPAKNSRSRPQSSPAPGSSTTSRPEMIA